MELTDLFSKKLLFVTGKGGIGKTTVSAALGQIAASQGIKTLIFENSAQDQISPLFGIPYSNNRRQQIQSNLSCINLSDEDNLKEYVTKYLKQEVLYEKVFKNKMVKSFFNVIPGFSEVMLLGRLFYTCELTDLESRPDLVIFDSPASGHFLSLMTTPQAIVNTNLGGPLAKETHRVHQFLKEKEKCGTIYVGAPEDLVVSEMLDFIPKLKRESPCELDAIVVNRSLKYLENVPLQKSEAHHLWSQRRDKAEKARQALHDGLSKESISTPIFDLPELGFIKEPLPQGFGSSFIKGESC